jgi:hypothetical protein
MVFKSCIAIVYILVFLRDLFCINLNKHRTWSKFGWLHICGNVHLLYAIVNLVGLTDVVGDYYQKLRCLQQLQGAYRKIKSPCRWYDLINKVQAIWIITQKCVWLLIGSFTEELRSLKYNNLILGIALGCIVMALHYLVKSAIFETAAFAIASIVGYFIVYRWFQRWED